MIVATKSEPRPFADSHDRFLSMLPLMRAQARFAFRSLAPHERGEAIQDVLALAFVMFSHLVRAGREHRAYATPLVQFAIRQYRVGRRVGVPNNINDVTSEQAQIARAFKLKRLDHYEADADEWREILIEDRKAGPAETAAARIDTAGWFRSLPRRLRAIARLLATGETTGAVARKFRVTAGCVSQLRRELAESWDAFHGQPVAA